MIPTPIVNLIKSAALSALFMLFYNISFAQFKGYKWSTIDAKGDMSAREEGDFVQVKNKFYLIGGRGKQPTSVFDPETNTWSVAAAPPLELHHFQSLVYNNEIYVCFGMTGPYPHEKPVDHIYIYNPAQGNWRLGPELPKDRLRGSAGSVVYNHKFYTVCGITDGHWDGNVAWFDEYDPATNQWKKLQDAPRVRDHFKAVTVGHKLYCIGGNRSHAIDQKVIDYTIAEVDVYDFSTGTWSTASALLPTPRAGCAAIAWGNTIVVMGGESVKQTLSHNEAEAYNIKEDKFTPLPSMIAGRHGMAALFYDRKIYIASGIGNRVGAPKLNSIECFSKQ